MEDNVFWYKVLKLVAIVFVSFIICVTGYNMHENVKISEAIKSGVSPEMANIAYNGRQTTIDQATIVAMMRGMKSED